MTSLEKDVSSAMRIDDIDKPATAATETPATETPAIDPPVTPTTPTTSIPETFTEADAETLAAEPLAITREVPPLPTPQDTAPAAPDLLKDAKAS
jgi:sec-independent protein translocase protein TatB